MDQATTGYKPVIEEIANFNWESLDRSQLSAVAWAYWYFSIQFRENLEATFRMYPNDRQLQNLVKEECDTDNLSPWPNVAGKNEKLNHDEFMKRLLTLSSINPHVQQIAEKAGLHYLNRVRRIDDLTKAMSIASYECGGLETVFKAILRAQDWDTPLLRAFKHFLVKHIDFDSDPAQGHGALIKHLVPDDRIRYLWVEFRDLLIISVPNLA